MNNFFYPFKTFLYTQKAKNPVYVRFFFKAKILTAVLNNKMESCIFGKIQ